MLIEPAAITAWRSAQAPVADDARLRAFAARIPQLLADAAMATFIAIEGPHKCQSAGVLAASWYASTVALHDAIRAEGLDVPELAAMPEEIAHLRAI